LVRKTMDPELRAPSPPPIRHCTTVDITETSPGRFLRLKDGPPPPGRFLRLTQGPPPPGRFLRPTQGPPRPPPPPRPPEALPNPTRIQYATKNARFKYIDQ
jgi:hypothetical protein